jgi:hypothetical protein
MGGGQPNLTCDTCLKKKRLRHFRRVIVAHVNRISITETVFFVNVIPQAVNFVLKNYFFK